MPDSTGSDGAVVMPDSVKLVVAGGFAVGKTTFIGAVSEIDPLSTEEEMTEASVGVDDLTGTELKRTTTVALDFGRITISTEIVLYLFGTPGQARFGALWNELSTGAIGAVVLLRDELAGGVDPLQTREVARSVAKRSTVELLGECHFSMQVVVLQVRSIAVDLLQATGLSRTEAIAALPPLHRGEERD